MKRRTFLKRSAPALALPLALNGMRLSALARTAGLNRILSSVEPSDRVLVIVQLEGGNDGLNTVIPVDDALYYNARPTLGIPKESALALGNEPLLRLHPGMEGMRRMYNEGRMAIVTNIGYNNYSLSHFSGIEVWNTASESSTSAQLGTGWIGRFLREDFPDYPDTLPDHPPAIQIRPATSSIFGIESSTIGMALTDPIAFHDLVSGSPVIDDDAAPTTLPGRELKYIRMMDTQAMEYSHTIREAALKANNVVHYPANPLAESMAIVARLIAGGLKTRVYMVSIGSFDTHGNQLQHQGILLERLSTALKAFSDDTIALGIDKRVVGMTYSEFGRRIAENASGTDHGAAAPHFVFGTAVDGGRIYGGLPDLANPDESGNLIHERTFQCYYASVLAPLFDLPESRMRTILPHGLCDQGERIDLYRSNFFEAPPAPIIDPMSFRCAPNPAASETTISFRLMAAGDVWLRMYSMDGRLVRTLIDGQRLAGDHDVRVELSSLPSASYTCELTAGGGRTTTSMVVLR